MDCMRLALAQEMMVSVKVMTDNVNTVVFILCGF